MPEVDSTWDFRAWIDVVGSCGGREMSRGGLRRDLRVMVRVVAGVEGWDV